LPDRIREAISGQGAMTLKQLVAIPKGWTSLALAAGAGGPPYNIIIIFSQQGRPPCRP
jgi:hypothetical protein